MTLDLAAATASVIIDQKALSGILNDVLFDRLMALGVKLTILLFFIAFTVAVILNLYSRLRFPVALRKYVYGTYVALMIGAALSLRAGGPEASARSAAREVTNVLIDSGRASEQRSGNVVPVATPEPGSARPSDRRIVYIQTPNVAARTEAERVRQALRDAGYMAPGIEIVDPLLTPGTAEVRYFNAQDSQSAAEVAKIARSNGLAVVPDEGKRQEGYKAPVGQIELWFPRPR